MSRIWSDEGKLARWLDVELAALDGWAEVGDGAGRRTSRRSARSAVAPTPERVAEIERTTDHDMAAFVDAVAEQLGPEGRWVHYGLTSSDVRRHRARAADPGRRRARRSPASTARSRS